MRQISVTKQFLFGKKINSRSFFIFFSILIALSQAHSKILIKMTGNLPSSIDNSVLPYFRPVFNQLGSSCGNACGIGNVFTYEMNVIRSKDASLAENQFPYLFTYHFLNQGNADSGTYHMFTNAWDIAIENGIPAVDIYGGFENGYPTGWMNGYSKYFSAMYNRVDQYDSVKITNPSSLDTIKQWLYDHGDGSSHGGIAVVTGNSWSVTLERIKTGPQAGKQIMLGFGANLSSNHALTIAGYNDSILYDRNGDGSYTNDRDINNDNKIDLKDWEIGALLLVNTWGSSFGDNGFAYLPYWTLAETPENRGSISDNHIFFCKVKKDVTIKAALQVQINNSHRNQMALSIGISENLQALSPAKVRSFKKQFNYAGGDFPMCGENKTNTIEMGLDITDLIDSINNVQQYRVFLIVDSKSNNGTITSVTLVDYTSGTPREYPSSQVSVPIKIGKTLISTQNAISTNGVQTRHNPLSRALQIKNTGTTLEIISPYSGSQQFQLHNLQGQLIRSFAAKSGQIRFITSDIVNGFYFVSVKPLDTRGPVERFQVFIGE
jgi:hypothetical protein